MRLMAKVDTMLLELKRTRVSTAAQILSRPDTQTVAWVITDKFFICTLKEIYGSTKSI